MFLPFKSTNSPKAIYTCYPTGSTRFFNPQKFRINFYYCSFFVKIYQNKEQKISPLVSSTHETAQSLFRGGQNTSKRVFDRVRLFYGNNRKNGLTKRTENSCSKSYMISWITDEKTLMISRIFSNKLFISSYDFNGLVLIRKSEYHLKVNFSSLVFSPSPSAPNEVLSFPRKDIYFDKQFVKVFSPGG